MQYIRLNFTQGTEDWRVWRQSIIGASDAPTIMGENRYKSIDSLIREKTGIGRVFTGNAATRRGHMLEPKARLEYNRTVSANVEPAVLLHGTRKWQAASVDGIDRHGRRVVEIKCGVKSHELTAKTKRPPSYYYAQLQHILSITGLPTIDFYSFLPEEEPILLVIERDDKYIKRLIANEEEFTNRYLKGIVPCPGCSAKLRLPRGKEGWVRCQRCQNRFHAIT